MTIDDRPDGAVLARIRMQVAAGSRPGSLAGLDARTARVIEVADEVGAPLIPIIEAAQEAAVQEGQIAAALRAAVAPARAVATALALLPLIAVPSLASIIGIDLGAFYTSPLGMTVAAIAIGMWLVGALITFQMIRGAGRLRRGSPWPRVVVGIGLGWLVIGPLVGAAVGAIALLTWRRPPPPPHPEVPAVCDLTSAALQAGLPLAQALREAAEHVDGLRQSVNRLALLVELGVRDLVARSPAPLVAIAEVVDEARISGGPAADALRSLARQSRTEVGNATREQAERLPTELTFPTVLLLLPATVLSIGAPIVASGLSTISG